MVRDPGDEYPDQLTPAQLFLLEDFVAIHQSIANVDRMSRSYYDWGSTFLEQALAERDVNLLDKDTTYFAVMAGMSIGTTYFEGLSLDSANTESPGAIIRIGFDQLTPPPLSNMGELRPEYRAYFKQVADVFSDVFRNKFGLDLSNPETFGLVQIGLQVGSEWMEGLTEKGRTPNEAGEIVRTSFVLLRPPTVDI